MKKIGSKTMSDREHCCIYCGKILTEKDMINGDIMKSICSKCVNKKFKKDLKESNTLQSFKDSSQKVLGKLNEKINATLAEPSEEKKVEEEEDEDVEDDNEEIGERRQVPLSTTCMVFIMMALVIGVGIYFVPSLINIANLGFKSRQITPLTDTYDLTLPIQFIIRDTFTSNLLENVTTNIYDAANLDLQEVLQGSTSETSKIYKSGKTYWVQVIYKEGNISYSQWFNVKPPLYESPTITGHYVQLDFYTLGRYHILVSGENGININSVYHTNSTYPCLSLAVYQLETNHGPRMFYDPIYMLDRYPTLTITVNDTKIQLQSMPISVAFLYEKIYGCQIEAEKLQKTSKPDGTIYSSGIYSFPLPFDLQAITSPVAINITLRMFDNLNYFMSIQKY